MKPYPIEFRQRVVALTADGLDAAEIADGLGVSDAWVRSIKNLHATGQPLDIKPPINKRRSLADREGDRIRAHLATKPGTTLEDLKRDLNLTTSISNLWYAIQALKISFKKKRSTPVNRSDPMSSAIAPRGRSSFRPSIPGGSSSSTKPSGIPP